MLGTYSYIFFVMIYLAICPSFLFLYRLLSGRWCVSTKGASAPLKIRKIDAIKYEIPLLKENKFKKKIGP